MFPINIVEKETGFSKYLLRMWERRYSFPKPARDEKGDRIYNHDDLEKLKIVKVLMKEGYRPSKIMNQTVEQLKILATSFVRTSETSTSSMAIVILTNPDLLEELKLALRNQKVTSVMVVHGLEDFPQLAL